MGVVLLAAGMTFGQSYGGNNPGPIEREIEKALSIDAEAFNLLYSATSLGQMVMPFLVGPLIQRVGLAQAAVTLAGLVAVGQLLTSLAVQFGMFWGALAGRLLLGMGESVVITQPCLLAQWLPSERFASAFGLILCVCKLLRVVNDNLEPFLFVRTGSLAICFWFATGVALFAVACALVLARLTPPCPPAALPPRSLR